jgi:hypothetical protein
MIAFGLYLNEAGTEARGIQVHPDSESLELHLSLVPSAMQEAYKYIEVGTFEVLGVPTDSLRAKLLTFDPQQDFWPLWAGFARTHDH